MIDDPLRKALLDVRDKIIDAIIVAETESKCELYSEEFRRNEVFISVGLRRAEEILLAEIVRLNRRDEEPILAELGRLVHGD